MDFFSLFKLVLAIASGVFGVASMVVHTAGKVDHPVLVDTIGKTLQQVAKGLDATAAPGTAGAAGTGI
jgi:hypothetical protein